MIEFLAAAVIGMTLHEFAHAFVATLGGDPTPRWTGRLSLNPLRHMHPIGSVVVPVLSLLSLGIVIGWGDPVPIDRTCLTRKYYLVALAAGPFMNLVVAGWFAAGGFSAGATVNLTLALVNLVPVRPLDGARILEEFRHDTEQRRRPRLHQ